MRFRPRNRRDENPEVFAQLVKTNPYMARVYDYPELLIPHPTPENFQQLWDSKKKMSLLHPEESIWKLAAAPDVTLLNGLERILWTLSSALNCVISDLC